MLKLSILIPSHNRPSRLKQLLESLAVLRYPSTEFIVALNPEVRSPLEEEFPWVQFCYSELGSNAARQQAFHHAHGEWCWFIDDDCLLPKTINQSLIQPLLEDPGVDAYAGTYSFSESPSFYTKAYFIISDCWQQLSFQLGFPALIGGNLLVRRSAIDESYWPSNIKFGGAELIFNLKALENNLRIKFEPNLEMIHNLPPLNQKDLKRKARLQSHGSWQIKTAAIEKYLSHPLISYALYEHPLYKSADTNEQKNISKGFKLYSEAFVSELSKKSKLASKGRFWHFVSQRLLLYEAKIRAEELK